MMRTRRGRGPIGLDVGSRWVKAAQARLGGSSPGLAAAARLPRRRPGEPVGIDEAECLLATLRRQGFEGDELVLAVPGERLLSGVLELPPRSSGAPLADLARLELARSHKCDPEKIEVAFWEVPGGDRATDGTHVMAVGCRHEDASALLDAFELAGARVVALDAPTTALARACARVVAASGGEPAELMGVIEIGWHGAAVGALLGGRMVYDRALPAGTLRDTHAGLVEKLGLDPDVAEHVLARIGVSGDAPAGPEGVALELLDEARSLLLGRIESLAAEAKTSLGYASRRHGTAPARLLVAGGGAGVPGLAESLGKAMGMKAHAVVPREVFAADLTDGTWSASPTLALAAGLALHERKGAAA